MAVIVTIAIVLVGCNSKDNTNEKEQTSQEETDIKQMVHDYSIGKLDAQNASITGTELSVTDKQDKETVYKLPDDEFFVSIAPFVNETHPCTFHSLTGCQGEMVEQEFDVHIEDTEGNVVINETMKSLENGFIDLWLPRDKTYQVKITHDGKNVESEISTFADDATCITTMQLS